jgi:hypothetical protein
MRGETEVPAFLRRQREEVRQAIIERKEKILHIVRGGKCTSMTVVLDLATNISIGGGNKNAVLAGGPVVAEADRHVA